MTDDFVCSVCKHTFKKAWSDKEAEQELVSTFGDIEVDECEIVCDDCYNIIMGTINV